jgi:hypothetical protein
MGHEMRLHETELMADRAAADAARSERMLRSRPPRPVEATPPHDTAEAPGDDPEAIPVPPPAAKPESPPGLVRAVGESLAKGATETASQTSMGRASQKAPSAVVAAFQALARAVKWERKRPGSGTVATPEPPDWVNAEPGLASVEFEPGSFGDVYQMTAKVGPYSTREECDEAQPAVLQEVVAEYAERYVGPGTTRGVRFSPEFLQQTVGEVWEEKRMHDFGPGMGKRPMIQRYVLLRFDSEVNHQLKQQLRRAVIDRRLRYTGVGLAALLASLGLAFAYLKTNLATGGRYRGRLRAAVLVVILGAVAAHLLI